MNNIQIADNKLFSSETDHSSMLIRIEKHDCF